LNPVAGYSGKPLWQKLGLKAGLRYIAVDAPADYSVLTDYTGSAQATNAPYDLAHVFVRDTAGLDRALDAWLPQLAAGGALWISWPKKSSALFRDLTEDGIRAAVLPRDWVDVKVCAVDADWSGLKLLRRRK
jgi:hypothetical protein